MKSMLIYFPHIPKAGGQTLLQCLYRIFGYQQCIKVWDPNFGADVSPKGFRDFNENQFEGMSAVVGHLSLRNFFANNYARNQFENGNVKILTSVRNPIERIISLYNFIVFNERHPDYEVTKKISLVDFAINQPANFQYNFLRPDDKSTLNRIFEIMDVFPVEKSIDGFSKYFEETRDIIIEGLEIQNRSIDRAKGGKLLSCNDLPRDVVFELKEKHKIDFNLYSKSRVRA